MHQHAAAKAVATRLAQWAGFHGAALTALRAEAHALGGEAEAAVQAATARVLELRSRSVAITAGAAVRVGLGKRARATICSQHPKAWTPAGRPGAPSCA